MKVSSFFESHFIESNELIPIRKNNVTIINGTSGVGKSSLLLNLAINRAKKGQKVKFISLDSSQSYTMNSILSILANQEEEGSSINLRNLNNSNFITKHKDHLKELSQKIPTFDLEFSSKRSSIRYDDLVDFDSLFIDDFTFIYNPFYSSEIRIDDLISFSKKVTIVASSSLNRGGEIVKPNLKPFVYNYILQSTDDNEKISQLKIQGDVDLKCLSLNKETALINATAR